MSDGQVDFGCCAARRTACGEAMEIKTRGVLFRLWSDRPVAHAASEAQLNWCSAAHFLAWSATASVDGSATIAMPSTPVQRVGAAPCQ